MNLAIISDLILVIIGLVAYFQFYKTLGLKAKKLERELHEEKIKKEEAQGKYEKLTEIDGEKIEGLLKEINQLKQEKEKEYNLRISSEKKVQLAIKKIDEVENRMKDWKNIQEATIADSQNIILKVGEEIYEKINKSLENEVNINKSLFTKISENISGAFAKNANSKTSELEKKQDNLPLLENYSSDKKKKDLNKEEEKENKENKAGKDNEKQDENILQSSEKKENSALENQENSSESNPQNCDQAQKLLSDFIDIAQICRYEVNKNIFYKSELDEKRAKLFLCEFALFKDEKIYIFDFKIGHYLAEYFGNLDSKTNANSTLKKRLEKYSSYINNPKYKLLILKVLKSLGVKSNDVIISVIIPKKSDNEILDNLDYKEFTNNENFQILDFDSATNLIL
jgi:hypothetical protein